VKAIIRSLQFRRVIGLYQIMTAVALPDQGAASGAQ